MCLDAPHVFRRVRYTTSIRFQKSKAKPKREIDLGRDLIDKMSAEKFQPEKYREISREGGTKNQGQKNYGRTTCAGTAREGDGPSGSPETKPPAICAAA
jgi:hypothetical protein